MRLVVAETGPLNYLALIGAIGLLPRLFGTVLIPEAVRTELEHPRTPGPVRAWLTSGPEWLQTKAAPPLGPRTFPNLGEGERAAIALAMAVDAVMVLMDDRVGVAAARVQGLAATGTLGVLERAAARRMIDLPLAPTCLKATNFRYRPQLLEIMLARHQQKGGGA